MPMKLTWKRIGAKTLVGTVGVMTYTLDQKPFRLTGGTHWHVTRGGIASSDRFGSAPTLPQAKAMAQQDADERVHRFAQAR